MWYVDNRYGGTEGPGWPTALQAIAYAQLLADACGEEHTVYEGGVIGNEVEILPSCVPVPVPVYETEPTVVLDDPHLPAVRP